MSPGAAELSALQAKIWNGHLALDIRLSPSDCRTFNQSDPYLISVPRLSYLPLLLPRLHTFFSPFLINPTTTTNPYDGYFTFESVPLRWHLPVGLLYDIYCSNPTAPTDPTTPPSFRLMLHFSTPPPTTTSSAQTPSSPPTPPPPQLPPLSPPILHDSFINSVKEADFLRSGTAKPIMSLSAADSKALWTSVQNHDLSTHRRIYSSLLPQNFRNVPLRIYIPTSSMSPTDPSAIPSIKVFQSHIPPYITPSSSTTTSSTILPPRSSPSLQPQTLGSALHTLLPSLFPSRRIPVLAKPILHGAMVPMSAELEPLARWAAYGDGWLCVVVVMN